MRKLLLLGGILLLAATSPVWAAKPAGKATAKDKAPAPPAARPVFEPDGSFGFCLGEQSYADGRKLTIALSKREEMNLGVSIPAAGFKLGSRYDLIVTLDDEEPRKIRAGALDATSLLLQMGGNLSFQKALANSRTLMVGAGGRAVTFDLPTMSSWLGKIRSCVEENKNKRDDRAAKAEQAMPEPLKALLITAGFTDITPLRMEGVSPEERPADYIWKTGKVLGGVRERLAPAGKGLSDLIGLHMQGLKSKCDGAFKAEIDREQTIASLKLRTAQAQCAPKQAQDGEAVTVAMLFYLTRNGGFTVFTHEGAGSDSTEALAARDKLAQAIITLARDVQPANR